MLKLAEKAKVEGGEGTTIFPSIQKGDKNLNHFKGGTKSMNNDNSLGIS